MEVARISNSVPGVKIRRLYVKRRTGNFVQGRQKYPSPQLQRPMMSRNAASRPTHLHVLQNAPIREPRSRRRTVTTFSTWTWQGTRNPFPSLGTTSMRRAVRSGDEDVR